MTCPMSISRKHIPTAPGPDLPSYWQLADWARREHAHRVWQAMQAVFGMVCLLESMHPLSGEWDSCTDEACRTMGWLREG